MLDVKNYAEYRCRKQVTIIALTIYIIIVVAMEMNVLTFIEFNFAIAEKTK